MGLNTLIRALVSSALAITANAGIHTTLPSYLTEVDVIIAGGGTVGLIIATRLAQADPSLSVLVIEQGTDNANLTSVIYPALFMRNVAANSPTALRWTANPSPHLANRAPNVASGGVLGGGSSINGMVYTRAQWDDFDAWAAPGWAAADVLPYLRKLEMYHGLTDAKATHGYAGPVHVSKGTHSAPRAERAFIEAAERAGGYSEMVDLQNLRANNASGKWYRYVSPVDGRRQDVVSRYLRPAVRSGRYSNLWVVVGHEVLRILFDGGKRAVGVEFREKSKLGQTGSANSSEKRQVRARKLVVASTGALGTPLLLERSGVGDPAVLGRAGVHVIESLPGVGNNLQDHPLMGYSYRTNLTPNETINGMALNCCGRDVPSMIAADDPQLGWNGHDAASKIRPAPADVAALGPKFKAVWDRDFKARPNRPLMVMGMFNTFFGDPSTLPAPAAEYVTLVPWMAYPYSRGHIHITGPELGDPYDFDVGYLADEAGFDLKSHIWAYKLQRKVSRAMDIFRGELPSWHPAFPVGSKAAVLELAEGPVYGDIEYGAGDDAAIVQFVRERVVTSWHSLGTCKMAPRAEGGVVDLNLNVYGVSRLKVCDLSVPPLLVAANTYNTALMLGEKAADIIIKDLGIGHKKKGFGRT